MNREAARRAARAFTEAEKDEIADAVLRLVKAVRDEVRPRRLDPIPTGPDPVEAHL